MKVQACPSSQDSRFPNLVGGHWTLEARATPHSFGPRLEDTHILLVFLFPSPSFCVMNVKSEENTFVQLFFLLYKRG